MSPSVESALLRSYPVSAIKRGCSSAISPPIACTYFEAMIIGEEALEIDVPAIDRHVVSVALEDRSHQWTNLQGRKTAHHYRAGQMMFIPAGMPGWWAFEGSRANVLHIHFEKNCLERVTGQPVGFRQIPLVCHEDDVLAGLGAELLRRNEANVPMTTLEADAFGVVLALRLQTVLDSRPPAFAKGGLAPWQVKRIKAYLGDQLDRDVALYELCELVGLSTSHLCTGFRLATGLPPHQWHMSQRVEKAKALLLDPKLSITEISLSVGYGNPGHFATLFRRATGSTPREWRRTHLT